MQGKSALGIPLLIEKLAQARHQFYFVVVFADLITDAGYHPGVP